MRVDITLGVARPAAAKWRGNRPPSEPDRMARGYASKRALRTFTAHSSRFSETKMLVPIETDCVCCSGSCRTAAGRVRTARWDRSRPVDRCKTCSF